MKSWGLPTDLGVSVVPSYGGVTGDDNGVDIVAVMSHPRGLTFYGWSGLGGDVAVSAKVLRYPHPRDDRFRETPNALAVLSSSLIPPPFFFSYHLIRGNRDGVGEYVDGSVDVPHRDDRAGPLGGR